MNQEEAGDSFKGKGKLFYDTYALYEIAKGSEVYKEYAQGYEIITTKMNLYELYYTLLKESNKELAERFFNELNGDCADIKDEDIKLAAKFRFKEIKKGLSYIDCLGYVVAKSLGVKFLTGDKEFKGMENVEFVK